VRRLRFISLLGLVGWLILGGLMLGGLMLGGLVLGRLILGGLILGRLILGCHHGWRISLLLRVSGLRISLLLRVSGLRVLCSQSLLTARVGRLGSGGWLSGGSWLCWLDGLSRLCRLSVGSLAEERLSEAEGSKAKWATKA